MALDETTVRVLISVGTTIITLPVGIYLGHFFALGRDKRNEYKQLVDPIRLKLIEKKTVTQEEINELKACLGNRVSEIDEIFTKEYIPSINLNLNDSGYDDFGNEMSVNEIQIETNKKKIEAARILLLNACKVK